MPNHVIILVSPSKSALNHNRSSFALIASVNYTEFHTTLGLAKPMANPDSMQERHVFGTIFNALDVISKVSHNGGMESRIS